MAASRCAPFKLPYVWANFESRWSRLFTSSPVLCAAGGVSVRTMVRWMLPAGSNCTLSIRTPTDLPSIRTSVRLFHSRFLISAGVPLLGYAEQLFHVVLGGGAGNANTHRARAESLKCMRAGRRLLI